MVLDEFEFEQLAENYNRVTIYKEIDGDMDTPVSLLSKLICEDNVFLLESAKQNKTYSRFSFLSFDLDDVFILKIDGLYKDGLRIGDISYFKEQIKENRAADNGVLWDFNGGYVGYLAYEFVSESPIMRRKLSKMPEILGIFYLVEHFLVYDNYTNRLYLGLSKTIDSEKTAHENYLDAEDKIDQLKSRLRNINCKNRHTHSTAKIVNQAFSKDEFINAVEKVKHLITEGEAIQVVISNFFDIKGLDPFLFYRNLRRINPSPYMYFFQHKDFKIVGSSPEIHIKVRKNIATIKPIAGTKPRGKNEEEFEKNRKELISDEKERAEHLMLVDLARNDLGRLAKKDTVRVEYFMHPEDYSHVIHLVSDVKAEMDEKFDLMDALLNTFPAGTLSGAPKTRAIEIIDEAEKNERGAYGGCIGYIGFNGNMDMAITIRTAVFNGDTARLQAGAGIVYDSVPESEYSETLNKLAALVKAGGLDDTLNR